MPNQKSCVILGCDTKAVAACNNCNMPVCGNHSKKIRNFYVCNNCVNYLKQSGLG